MDELSDTGYGENKALVDNEGFPNPDIDLVIKVTQKRWDCF